MKTPRELQVLNEMGRSLLGTVDLDEQMSKALLLAMDALGADRGSIMISDSTTKALRIRYCQGLPDTAMGSETALGEGISGWVAQHREALVLHGDIADSRFQGIDPTLGSALCVPMLVDTELLGVLNLSRRSGERFTETDLKLSESLADMASIGIEKARMHTELKDRESRVSDLLAALINSLETERRRIAADIHDGFLQDLSAYFLKAETVKNLLRIPDLDGATSLIDEMQSMVKDQINEVRSYIFEMRPTSLDEIGLAPTLAAMVGRTASIDGPVGKFVNDAGSARLPEAIEVILYRTAQEGLRNIVKHAKATSFELTLDRNKHAVTLTLRDDGRGIKTKKGKTSRNSYGIDMMRERVTLAGGTFSIVPLDPKGTVVTAVIPLDA
ncbi:MAG: GAF domain-containing sensor histidine kinase [Actinomycetota bacterium]